jgi:hypothetical protein
MQTCVTAPVCPAYATVCRAPQPSVTDRTPDPTLCVSPGSTPSPRRSSPYIPWGTRDILRSASWPPVTTPMPAQSTAMHVTAPPWACTTTDLPPSCVHDRRVSLIARGDRKRPTSSMYAPSRGRRSRRRRHRPPTPRAHLSARLPRTGQRGPRLPARGMPLVIAHVEARCMYV